MTLRDTFAYVVADYFSEIGLTLDPAQVTITPTGADREGDFTILVFPLAKDAGVKPDALANVLGKSLLELGLITRYEVVKGFLNLFVIDRLWSLEVENMLRERECVTAPTHRTELFEFASPNTNKPLHLGHLRNIFLGDALARISQAAGNSVVRTCLVNDRGIHICKSMAAYQNYGFGATPKSTGIKGDHFVGDYYVKYAQVFAEQSSDMLNRLRDACPKDDPMPEKELQAIAEENSPIFIQARGLLRKWEAGDPATLALWAAMNQWVYAGFAETYAKIDVSFDKLYYESDIYQQGKDIVLAGAARGVFYQNERGAVVADVPKQSHPVMLLRPDGTSLYMTQDLALVEQKGKDYLFDASLYVVGNEQDHHLVTLKKLLVTMGSANMAEKIHHVSYGMVELPDGRMKSREGNVVDADDLIAEMVAVAARKTEALGKAAPDASLYLTLGLGALKYYLLKYDPQSKIKFDPEQSIDFHGDSGVYVQYTYAKIQSLLAKAGAPGEYDEAAPSETEKRLIAQLVQYADTVKLAARLYSPSTLVTYVMGLARAYAKFYAESPVTKEADTQLKSFRIALTAQTGRVIAHAMSLLGIAVPERM